jgi:hypothetical protein
VEVEAQVRHGNSSSTATERDTIKPPMGSLSWIPFHCHFKAVVKHNWADREKAMHLLAINALHSIL